MRSNQKLQNASKPQGIVIGIKSRRPEWLGHVIGMGNTGITKKNDTQHKANQDQS
jgi:hypothetical protein